MKQNTTTRGLIIHMITLGIDPGLAIMGYGVVEEKKNQYKTLAYGAIRTESSLEMEERLKILYTSLLSIIDEYRPEALSVERLFFYRNVSSAMEVGQARGVAILAGAMRGLPFYEYTPPQIKQAVTSNPRAEKAQVGYMVRAILGLPKVPKPDDVADALAAAICHINMRPRQLEKIIQSNA